MKPSDIERFWTKVDRRPDGCWVWTGTIDNHGYGTFKIAGRNVKAHRVAYALANGEVAPGLVVDHTCHNASGCHGGNACPHRRCINPAHLEAVTTAENIRRSPVHGRNQWVGATHCVHGHEFAGDNLRIGPSGRRHCRACEAAADRRRRARERAARGRVAA